MEQEMIVEDGAPAGGVSKLVTAGILGAATVIGFVAGAVFSGRRTRKTVDTISAEVDRLRTEMEKKEA